MKNSVLIIDDDKELCELLTQYLQLQGFSVESTHDGAQALRQLQRKQYDVLVLDIMLPGMHGLDVLRELRESNNTPVLMLTARGEDTDRIVGLELGADAYLTKPFAPSELLAQVRALFRLLAKGGLAVDAARPLLCGPLTLWSEQHRVELAGQAVELTPKEFALLELFMRRPGTVFGRETLLREVWGYEYLGDSRTVDVHIQRLRAKIEDDSSQPQILHTVRGFGYRLVAVD